MTLDTNEAAKALQKIARGYITRKTGLGGRKGGRHARPTRGRKGGKQPKTRDMQAQVIQLAFKEYKAYQRGKNAGK